MASTNREIADPLPKMHESVLANRREAYAEKLRDPRWQKKRLEIFERDGWACKCCGAASETLHVHHRRYLFGREPWDNPQSDLVTLCETCHALEPDSYKKLIFWLEEGYVIAGLFAFDLAILLSIVEAISKRESPRKELRRVADSLGISRDESLGLAAAAGLGE